MLACRYQMLCRICIVRVQPRKHVHYHADYSAPTRYHEVDHDMSGIHLKHLNDLQYMTKWESIIRLTCGLVEEVISCLTNK